MAEIRVRPKPRSLAWLWVLLIVVVLALIAWYLIANGIVRVNSSDAAHTAAVSMRASHVLLWS